MPPLTLVPKTRATEMLFSYGMLQLAEVQQATFSRLLQGQPDSLPGFHQSLIKIQEADVVAVSGKTQHPIVQYTGNMADAVVETVLALTQQELQHADSYEVDAYKRVAVRLRSERQAWVYIDVLSPPLPPI